MLIPLFFYFFFSSNKGAIVDIVLGEHGPCVAMPHCYKNQFLNLKNKSLIKHKGFADSHAVPQQVCLV